MIHSASSASSIVFLGRFCILNVDTDSQINVRNICVKKYRSSLAAWINTFLYIPVSGHKTHFVDQQRPVFSGCVLDAFFDHVGRKLVLRQR